jgi:hypothetical protein
VFGIVIILDNGFDIQTISAEIASARMAFARLMEKTLRYWIEISE